MRVTIKGQITIPQHIREKLGIAPATEIDFIEEKGHIYLVKSKGIKRSPLPDFYIGAQAAILDLGLITRDVPRYRTYFPTVRLTKP